MAVNEKPDREAPQPGDDRPVTVGMLKEALGWVADETFSLLRTDFEAVNKLLAAENAFVREQLDGLRRDLLEQSAVDREEISKLRSSVATSRASRFFFSRAGGA